MIKVKFSKFEGLGNDFVVLDSALLRYSFDYSWICDRKFGIGADAVLFVEIFEKAENGELQFGMRIFNNDGTEAEMCGNGIRCVAKYIFDLNPCISRVNILTKAGPKLVELDLDGLYSVNMGPPILDISR